MEDKGKVRGGLNAKEREREAVHSNISVTLAW